MYSSPTYISRPWFPTFLTSSFGNKLPRVITTLVTEIEEKSFSLNPSGRVRCRYHQNTGHSEITQILFRSLCSSPKWLPKATPPPSKQH
jgi:hypothetical protein